jgi:hypothetical protein
MLDKLSSQLDRLSEFLAHRKGLLPIIGMLLVLLNFVLQVFPAGWLAQTNFFLHLGIIIAIFGFMLARAL